MNRFAEMSRFVCDTSGYLLLSNSGFLRVKIPTWHISARNYLTYTMLDAALSSRGAQVVLATSSDENHPPENIIDGSVDC